jgi:anhydro-N-acetylmuramic acid kinase
MSRAIAKLAAKTTLRVVGLMSGTSVDGVDAAIVDVTGRRVKLLAFETFPYPPALRERLFALFDPATARIDELSCLNFAVGEAFADAVLRLTRRSGIALRSIDLIGSHGQTVWHDPEGRRVGRRKIRSTLQIGEPCVIAERTGITTVADFRPRDVAAGGQGAPLVPRTDWILFRHRTRNRAVQNIGGIANVTYLPAGAAADDVIAFDTGPGNMIIDRIIERVTNGTKHFDADGRIAASGKVDARLLREMSKHPFLRRRPPKTTGREEFGAAFTDAIHKKAKRRGVCDTDLIATVTALTATTIADAYRRFLPAPVDEVILCGGGARNPTLTAMLQEELPDAKVAAMDEWGLNADAKEAISFALLARQTIRGSAGSIPHATGADHSTILGKIIPAGITRRGQ